MLLLLLLVIYIDSKKYELLVLFPFDKKAISELRKSRKNLKTPAKPPVPASTGAVVGSGGGDFQKFGLIFECINGNLRLFKKRKALTFFATLF